MKKIVAILAILILSVGYIQAQETERYSIKNLDINNEYSNFGTSYYGKDKIIYASPRKGSKMIKSVWKPNDQPFLDLYIGDVAQDGEITNVTKLNKDVNSRYHEADVVYTNDLKTVYFTRDNYYEGELDKDKEGMVHLGLFRADVVDSGEWKNVEPLPFNNPEYSVGHPALSPDNKTLYFVSDIPGGYGQTDIYKVSINEDGTFGSVINLGSKVNTPGREMFPFMASENILYYSSDKPGGMGNLDIYAAKLDGRSDAINLGMPINSFNDDFAFLKRVGDDYGYFSSNRTSGKGDDDIYYFKELVPLKMPCNQVAEGVVRDKNTGRRIPGALVILYDAEGNELDVQIVKEDAKFTFDVDCESNYKVVGSKSNYSEDSKEFTSNAELELGLDLDLNIESEAPKASEAVVAKAEYDSCQEALDNINNIYFDLDKSYIRPDAASELDKVVRIMKRCPNIKIEASSHTDSRASHKYNEALSQRRAQSTVDYIVNVGGISPDRIRAVGYGETRLRNRCSDGVKCSETEHQVNRRTQFDISNY
jgi:outer membrane protein OmpA-like peptidoglycan-associated protein